MKSSSFSNQAKINSAISNFKNLLNHPGWKLYLEILDANIEVVRNRLLNGVEGEETKDDIDRLRDKLRIYNELKNTPQSMIDKLMSNDFELPDDDPYETVNQLKSRRKKLKS